MDTLLNAPLNDRMLSVVVRLAKIRIDSGYAGDISLAKVAETVHVSIGHR